MECFDSGVEALGEKARLAEFALANLRETSGLFKNGRLQQSPNWTDAIGGSSISLCLHHNTISKLYCMHVSVKL